LLLALDELLVDFLLHMGRAPEAAVERAELVHVLREIRLRHVLPDQIVTAFVDLSVFPDHPEVDLVVTFPFRSGLGPVPKDGIGGFE